MVKEAAITDSVDGRSATLNIVTLEGTEYKIEWDSTDGAKILSTK